MQFIFEVAVKFSKMTPMNTDTIAVVGLGYVGLPLAHAFDTKGYTTIGFDINVTRIEQLQNGIDHTNELENEEVQRSTIKFTYDAADLQLANIVIVAIPTPVDNNNTPDLSILKKATQTVGSQLQKGAIVVFESTVYPGVTEDICVPILEEHSSLTNGIDFWVGYSPERINPGDKTHRLETIIKIVAGQDEATLAKLTDVYGSIIDAGIHQAPNIKVAEMAKAIENAQRDLNIAFINEVAKMCSALDVQTKDVLDAAGTKWNFLPFTPGLVGGHCIGVDPYYLVEKAKQLGIDTDVITAGRKTNDGMSTFIGDQILAPIKQIAKPTVLVLGVTFKPNVPDTRNSKVRDVVLHLQNAGCLVEAHDPWFTAEELTNMRYNASAMNTQYDAVVALVAHDQYKHMNVESIQSLLKPSGLLYDLSGMFTAAEWGNYEYQTL